MVEFPDTRDSLIQSLQADDRVAWMDFAEIYETVIYRVAVRTGLQHADALDVVQEVLGKVYRKIGDWDANRTDGRFRNWVHRLTVNASIDVIRQRKRHITSSGDSAVQRSLEQIVASADETTHFQVEYRRAVFQHVAAQIRTEVSEKSWNAFWMTAIEDQRPTDVARTLGLTVGSVYAHKCRVLARIRKGVQNMSTEVSLEIEAEE